MKKDIIIRFNYQNKEFAIFVENNQMNFGYKEKGTIHKALTEEEYELMAKVYNSLTINNDNSIDCGLFKIKGKQIKIFFNQISKLYYFYELVNNELKIPKKEDLIILNKYYNNQEEYLVDQYDNPKLEDYPNQEKEVKRILKLKTSTIAIFIAASLAFQNLPVLNYSTYYLFNKPLPKTEKEKEDYSFAKIKSAVENNNKLTEEEKSFVLTIEDELEENKEYIDTEMICENLSDLDIIYNKDKKKSDSSYSEIAGTYTTIGLNKNAINLYEETSYSSSSKKTLFHEINHSLTSYNSISENTFFSDENYLTEMVNELYSYEYYDKITKNNLGEPNRLSYNFQMPLMYPLCEILDIKTIKKFKYDNKLAYIIEDLLSIDPDIKKAGELITAINSIDLYEQNYQKSLNGDAEGRKERKSEETIQAEEERYQNKEKIYSLIKNYYEKKYHKDMTEDQIMMLYFCDKNFTIEEAKNKINSIYGSLNEGEPNCTRISMISPKGYISEEYKKNHHYLAFRYRENEVLNVVKIDDYNRYSKAPIPVSQKISFKIESDYGEKGNYLGNKAIEVEIPSNSKVR